VNPDQIPDGPPGGDTPERGAVAGAVTTLPERLEMALAELGALSPDGIAGLARAKGVKAVLRDPCLCPVAKLLGDALAGCGVKGIYVDGESVEVWIETSPNRPWMYDRPLPESAQEFAGRFDKGRYMDLVDSTVHVIQVDEDDTRGQWSCICGRRGGSPADSNLGDIAIAAEKHLSPGDRAVYRWPVPDA
jgi:hypothetical protein